MELTKLRGRMLCIPHLNGMIPRGRYIGCDACEEAIAADRAGEHVESETKPKRVKLTIADKLRRLRGGRGRKRKSMCVAEPRNHPQPLTFTLEAAIRKLWPTDCQGWFKW